jgi:hypothetical protein
MSRSRVWSGRTLSTIAVLFLLMDGGMKVARAQPSVAGTTALGFPDASVATVGTLVLGCTALYVLPATAAVGAVLLTGFLGGAVSAQVRVNAPLFSNVLFPVYLAAFVWGGLLLRRPHLWQAALARNAPPTT